MKNNVFCADKFSEFGVAGTQGVGAKMEWSWKLQ